MIQMCVYNSILAGRLGDCWLAPRRLQAGPWETAGWPLGRLAGPWEGWMAPGKAATAGCTRRLLAGVCWFAEFADFHWFCCFSPCCCLVVGAQGWRWFFSCSHADLTGNGGSDVTPSNVQKSGSHFEQDSLLKCHCYVMQIIQFTKYKSALWSLNRSQ